MVAYCVCSLWGVGCVQLYIYYEKYWRTDQHWFKVYMFAIWILDTAHQALVVVFTYSFFVSGIKNPALLTHLPRAVMDSGVLIAIIDAMVQIIYVRRAWYLSNKNRLLTVILCAAVLAPMVLAIIYCGQLYKFSLLAELPRAIHIEIALNSVVAFSDMLIALVMIWMLWNSRPGVKRTDTIVNRLIAYTIGSGLVTALWVIVALIAAQVKPHSFVYLLVDLVLPKLYFNSVLASLNARSALRETLMNEEISMELHFSNGPLTYSGREETSTGEEPRLPEIGSSVRIVNHEEEADIGCVNARQMNRDCTAP
ncbi:hypothetical protein ACEPAG_2145 [Sanghuangporus baumii]